MRSAAHLSIESMCRLGQVSRAGFYRHWKQHEPRVEQAELRARMHQIVLTHRRNYGYRRVTQELRNQGWAVNHKRVARLMAEDNLLCLRKRSFVRTTDSRHDLRVYVNLASRMQLTGIDQLWVADLTFLRLAEEFLYLAVVLDAFSPPRAWLGAGPSGWMQGLRWPLCARRSTCASLRPGLVHHSDRGVQYASKSMSTLLLEHGIAAQHEPGRQPVRQRQVRELPQDPQAGGDLYPAISRPAPIWRPTSASSWSGITIASGCTRRSTTVRQRQFEQSLLRPPPLPAASMSFFRHGEIYRPDVHGQAGEEPL